MDNIEDRIQILIDFEKLTLAAFAKKIGVLDQTLRNSLVKKTSKPGYGIIYAICTHYEWLNANWLITGKGEMRLQQAAADDDKERNIQSLLYVIRSQQDTIRDLAQGRSPEPVTIPHRNKESIASDVKESYKK